jgi:hypothetical protein
MQPDPPLALHTATFFFFFLDVFFSWIPNYRGCIYSIDSGSFCTIETQVSAKLLNSYTVGDIGA